MKFLWILMAGMMVWAQDSAGVGEERDALGRLIRDGQYRYSYVPNGSGIARITLDGEGREVSRAAYSDSIETPPEGLVEVCSVGDSEWGTSGFGLGIGLTGMVIGDFNGNGMSEIFLTGSSVYNFSPNNFWHVVEYDGEDYRQIHLGPTFDQPILKMFQTTSNEGEPRLITVLRSGAVIWTDPVSYQQLDQIQLQGVTQISDLVWADLEGDGTPEFVVSDSVDLRVYSAVAPFAQLKTYYDKGGPTVAVGNLDDDPALELASEPTNGHGFVIDGGSDEVQWDYPMGFGVRLAAADIDGDMIDEIVGLEAWYVIRAFDADLKVEKWKINTSHDLQALNLTDIEGDGTVEVLVGEGQWGSLRCYAGDTGAQRWLLNNPEHGMTHIELADVDGDHRLDILWGAGFTSTGPDHLFVSDVSERMIKWSSPYFEGAFECVASGDLNGDTIPELIGCASRGWLLIFDGASKALIYQTKLAFSGKALVVGDVDADGTREIVVAGEGLYSGRLQVIDGQSHEIVWETQGFNGVRFAAVTLANIDDDPQAELLVGEQQTTTGAAGARLRIFDVPKSVEQWTSAYLATNFGGVFDLLVEDLRNDGGLEIVAGTSSGTYVFEAATRQQLKLIPVPTWSLAAANLDQDPALELVLGASLGQAHVYDGATLLSEGTKSLFASEGVKSVRLVDFDGDGACEWIAQSDHELSVFYGRTGFHAWSPDACKNMTYKVPQLVAANLDEDPDLEIYTGVGVALRVFEPHICNLSSFYQELPEWPNLSVTALLDDLCP